MQKRKNTRWNIIRSSNRDGMSLVELMVALMVLSTGLLAVASLFPYGSSSSVDDRNLTAATDLAQQKMEQLRGTSFFAPDLTQGWHPTVNGEQVGNNNFYNRRYMVVDTVDPIYQAKYILVEVTWADARPDTIRLQTYRMR